MGRIVRGALVGVAASAIFALMVNHAMMLVCTPGAIALGGLLGWCGGRLASRGRALAMIGLGLACAIANAPVSGIVNRLMDDPMGLHQHGFLNNASVGLLGAWLLWWMIVPIGVAAGLACTRWRAPRPSAAPSDRPLMGHEHAVIVDGWRPSRTPAID